MTKIFDTLRELDSHGVAIIREAHGKQRWEFPRIFSRGEVDELRRLATVFFGSTRYTVRQRAVVETAERNQHAWTTLAMIHQQIKGLPEEATRWEVWEELVAITGTVDQIKSAAKAKVAELSPPKPPRTVSHSYTSGEDGMTKVSYTIPTPDFHAIRARFQDSVDTDKAFREGEGEAFLEYMKSLDNPEAVASAPTGPKYSLVISATVSRLTKVLNGEGDELLFGCSDGTVLTGDQVLNVLPICEILGGLFHEEHGWLQLRRFARCANETQRIVLAAESPTCVRPGCGMPIDRSQIHHIQAFQLGGETNIGNLAPLCKRHNGMNDDDATKPLHGRIERINGKPVHVGAYPNARPRMNEHPRAKLGAMHQLGAEDVITL